MQMRTSNVRMNFAVGMILAMVLLALPILVLGQETPATPSTGEKSIPANAISTKLLDQADPMWNAVAEGALIWLNLPNETRGSRLERCTVMEGVVTSPVYSGREIAIPSGARVRFEVRSVEKMKLTQSNKERFLRALDRAFNPLDHNHPAEYVYQLRDVALVNALGETVPLQAAVLRVSTIRQIRSAAGATTERNRASDLPESENGSAAGGNSAAISPEKKKEHARKTLLLRLEQAVVLPQNFFALSAVNAARHSSSDIGGETAHAYLLTSLSAEKNHEGDIFQARLTEPFCVAGSFAPAGTLVEGRVARRTPPRWLSRPGMLVLEVNRILPSDGKPLSINGSLEQAEADAWSPFVMDEEGTMRGRKPGIGKALVDIGYGYVVGKFADDLSEAPIRAIAAGMSATSVAAAARYVGFGTASIFLVTRRGRDVRLPKYAEIEIQFGRVQQAAGQQQPAAF